MQTTTAPQTADLLAELAEILPSLTAEDHQDLRDYAHIKINRRAYGKALVTVASDADLEEVLAQVGPDTAAPGPGGHPARLVIWPSDSDADKKLQADLRRMTSGIKPVTVVLADPVAPGVYPADLLAPVGHPLAQESPVIIQAESLAPGVYPADLLAPGGHPADLVAQVVINKPVEGMRLSDFRYLFYRLTPEERIDAVTAMLTQIDRRENTNPL
jgi:hypothetical protein